MSLPRLVFLTVILLTAANPKLSADENGSELIGQRAPKWELEGWYHSPALALEDLRGKVVLVRWWTAPDCPYCKATAPALNEFSKEFADRGLVVIGVYHHKAPGPLKAEDVKRYADKLGFEFPVAIDPHWQTLKKWWLDSGDRQWTSVSFLLDRQGRIRHIHPGGQYVKGDDAYDLMRKQIQTLLAEPK